MEEPDEVVDDDERAGRDEGRGGERDERPRAREVLQVDDVAEDGEEHFGKWERVRPVEEDVQCDDGLAEDGHVGTRCVGLETLTYIPLVPISFAFLECSSMTSESHRSPLAARHVSRGRWRHTRRSHQETA